jgi:hypothetical protein
MREGPRRDDRALLTVTAWAHEGELLGVIRWRSSLADEAEVVTPARGMREIVEVVAQRLGELDLANGDV